MRFTANTARSTGRLGSRVICLVLHLVVPWPTHMVAVYTAEHMYESADYTHLAAVLLSMGAMVCLGITDAAQCVLATHACLWLPCPPHRHHFCCSCTLPLFLVFHRCLPHRLPRAVAIPPQTGCVVLHVNGKVLLPAAGGAAGPAAATAAANFTECFILARTPAGEYYVANQAFRLLQ